MLKELPPRFAGHLGELDRFDGATLLDRLQPPDETIGQGSGERSRLAALWVVESDRLSVEVDVPKLDGRFGQAASGVDGNLETVAHPTRLIFERETDGLNVVVGQVRLFLGVFLGHSKAVTDITGAVLKPGSLSNEQAKYLDVVKGRVEFHGAAATLLVLHAPAQVAEAILIGELARNANAPLAQVHAQPGPCELVAAEGKRAGAVTLEERSHPILPAFVFGVGVIFVLSRSFFGFDGAGLFQLARIAANVPRGLRLSHPVLGINKVYPEKTGVLAVVQKGHEDERNTRHIFHASTKGQPLSDKD